MKSTQRIALLLVLVFLIPVLFFSVYELSSLDEEEKMMEKIYNKQLEAILFSVNQYSDDIINNWVSKTETALQSHTPADSIPKKISELLQLNSSINGIFILDTIQEKNITPRTFFQSDINQNAIMNSIMIALKKMPEKIDQLITYKKNGFQKIESIDSIGASDESMKVLVFISQAGNQFRVSGFVINSNLLIDDIIGPRLQTISRDQFVLSVLQKENDSIIYSTSTRTDSLASIHAVTKDFWIFPQYSIGIHAAGDGIEKLINERTTINMTLLVGLDITLIIALLLVYRSLKKEVDLAQNKADFVSNVSHEIRTPLALISMFAETLEMNRIPSEEKKQEYYRIISKETQRLTGIVNKILVFSQVEAKKKRLSIERLNMSTEIRGILETYEYHLNSKGFSYTIQTSDPLWIRADREALTESFINLLDNAIKYSNDTKRVEISLGKLEGFAFVAVKDFGAGISKKDQRYIFDKFYRVPKGNLARTQGTGLGLALVKQLTEEQKGKVSVQSELGKGSIFTLFYPLD